MNLEAVSNYKLLKKIGSGGMGEVYLAQDKRLKRKVALKVLQIHSDADVEKINRFEKEARAASALSHPNILSVHDVGRGDTFRYIVSEFIDGVTLREYLARGPVPLKRTIEIVTDVAKALSAAHETGIIHRDIKPENIMVRKDGLVKVLDFGLAKLDTTVDANISLTATTPGLILGTPKYMSPEQVRGFEVDQTTDIFSLGVVLYEMITGVPPFAGATVGDAIAAVLTSDPAPVSDYVSDIDPAVQRTLDRCLDKDAQSRFKTMRGLLASLSGINTDATGVRNGTRTVAVQATEEATLQAESGLVGEETVGKEPIPTTELPKGRKTGRITAAIAAAFILAGIVGFVVFQGSLIPGRVNPGPESAIPVRVIDPAGGENPEDLDDLVASWETAEPGLDPGKVSDVTARDKSLNVSATFLDDRQRKALEARAGEKGIRPPGLDIPPELFGGVEKQKAVLFEMAKDFDQPMDFGDMAKMRLNNDLIELPMASQSFYLDVGGSASEGPFNRFSYDRGLELIQREDIGYSDLSRLAGDFSGTRYNLDDPSDRVQIRRRLLRMLHPTSKVILYEVADAYLREFGRPLKIIALTRPMDFHIALNAANNNSFKVSGKGVLPPHGTGLAFDIARTHMPVAEQNFVMKKLAEFEREARVDALIEYGENACFHVFCLPSPDS